MRDLNHDFKQLGRRNRDGSFQTQHDRESILALVANQLAEGGFQAPSGAGDADEACRAPGAAAGTPRGSRQGRSRTE